MNYNFHNITFWCGVWCHAKWKFKSACLQGTYIPSTLGTNRSCSWTVSCRHVVTLSYGYHVTFLGTPSRMTKRPVDCEWSPQANIDMAGHVQWHALWSNFAISVTLPGKMNVHSGRFSTRALSLYMSTDAYRSIAFDNRLPLVYLGYVRTWANTYVTCRLSRDLSI